ncbi:nucleotidyltransferase family protein [Acidovorax sp. CF316]|nr:nucleotidyltransferase family protein [Acidovorax sp. CF316]
MTGMRGALISRRRDGIFLTERMLAGMQPAPDIVPQLTGACAVLAHHLGDGLRAIHLYGSAVHGGLQPRSDIDLMVTVAQPLAGATREALMCALLAHSAPPGSPGALRALEVTVVVLGEVAPWRYPARREMQFGEWLRGDILAGRFEPAMPDPDLAILLTKLRLHSVALVGPPAVDLFAPVPASDLRRALADTIAQWDAPPDWQGEEASILLALARIWYSASTGAIASKDAAAAWAAERMPPEHAALVQRAARAYLDGLEDGGLAAMPDAVAATIHWCKARIAQLLRQKPAG